jgi:hypothetical protein
MRGKMPPLAITSQDLVLTSGQSICGLRLWEHDTAFLLRQLHQLAFIRAKRVLYTLTKT